MKLSEFLSGYPERRPTRAAFLAFMAYGAGAGTAVCVIAFELSYVGVGLLVSYLLLGKVLERIDNIKHLSDLEQGAGE